MTRSEMRNLARRAACAAGVMPMFSIGAQAQAPIVIDFGLVVAPDTPKDNEDAMAPDMIKARGKVTIYTLRPAEIHESKKVLMPVYRRMVVPVGMPTIDAVYRAAGPLHRHRCTER